MTSRALVAFAAALVVGFLVASCGPTAKPCGPSTCADGCCDELGECVAGTALFECGAGGASCTRCQANQSCQQGTCSLIDGGDYDASFLMAPDAAFDPEAGVYDAGPDAGADAGTDAGRPDAGVTDAGRPDAGPNDAGAADAGHPDAGRPDAGADAGQVSYAADIAPIFSGVCGSCHTWNYANVVNMVAGSCGTPLVVPSMPSQSLIYQKVTGTQACGGAMPPAGSLSAGQIDLLDRWILQGALDN